MQTVEEFKNEEALNKKIRQKRRIRGVLIIVNALLIAYAGYLSVASIIDLVKNNQQIEEGDVITLQGKTVEHSLKLYEEYITNKVDVVDVATYGKYLVTSSSRANAKSFTNSGTSTLVKVVSDDSPNFNEPNLTYTLTNKLDSQIDLFTLEEGDYIICKDFDVTKPNIRDVYHYTGEEMFTETLYSYPSSDGSRTKIDIKGKNSSPALVVTVTNISACPEDYYDFVVLNSSTLELPEWVSKLEKSYKVKVVSTLVEAYKTKATNAINLVDGETITKSNFISDFEGVSNSTLIQTSVLQGLDEDNAIRELGGYLFNAGYGVSSEETNVDISNASISINNNSTSSHKAKLTLTIGDKVSEETVLTLINQIF